MIDPALRLCFNSASHLLQTPALNGRELVLEMESRNAAVVVEELVSLA